MEIGNECVSPIVLTFDKRVLYFRRDVLDILSSNEKFFQDSIKERSR